MTEADIRELAKVGHDQFVQEQLAAGNPQGLSDAVLTAFDDQPPALQAGAIAAAKGVLAALDTCGFDVVKREPA